MPAAALAQITLQTVHLDPSDRAEARHQKLVAVDADGVRVASVEIEEQPKHGRRDIVASNFAIDSAPAMRGAVLDLLLSALVTAAVDENGDGVRLTALEPLGDDLRRQIETRAIRHEGSAMVLADFRDSESSYACVNRLAYDVLADEYRSRADHPEKTQESAERLAGFVVDRLTQPVSSILEIGPGAGEVLEVFSRSARKLTAVELSPKMAEIAKARCPHADMIIADILDLSFEARSFDGVYAGALIHLLPPSQAATLVQRLSRWLRADGVAFLNTSIALGDSVGMKTKVDYQHRISRFRSSWTERSFRSLLEANGLEIIERVTTDETERRKFWVGFVCTPHLSEDSNVDGVQR